ncbi:MAG TPA: hypothetical protein VI172_18475, partial [Candidatus Dormibacteraeota bacterium]
AGHSPRPPSRPGEPHRLAANGSGAGTLGGRGPGSRAPHYSPDGAGDPGAIVLKEHEVITLEITPPAITPPPAFDWPPGF